MMMRLLFCRHDRDCPAQLLVSYLRTRSESFSRRDGNRSDDLHLVHYCVFSAWGYLMQHIRQHNSEYMHVVCEVVECLVTQLHHPKLSSPSADEITEWFNQVSREEVEVAIERLRKAKRIP
jgi:hypothetical protein